MIRTFSLTLSGESRLTLLPPSELWLLVILVLEKYVSSERIHDAFLKAFEIITPVGLSGEDVIRAARLKWRDYEDCLIAVCADKAKADYLITRDKRGFERSSVPALTPVEWLEMMERDHRTVYDVEPCI